MATLGDSFLADLDELCNNNEADEYMDGDDYYFLADIEKLKYDDDLDSVSKLHKTQRYNDIMNKVENALEKNHNINHGGCGGGGIVYEDDDDSEEYHQLVADCNAVSVDIDNEIVIVHNFIRDKYRSKFPELESVVQQPVDYALVVKRIGNEMDLTLVDLEGILPSATIMVVSITASTTTGGKQLSEKELQKTMDACDRVLVLDSDKKKIVDFVESRMGYIAPNLSDIVGSAVAAKLMATAGGLSALAKMPACDVLLLGAKKKALDTGFSSATSQYPRRVGYLEQSEVFHTTPPSLRMRACRLLAAKSTLAARVDSTRGTPIGSFLREEIRRKIQQWQEAPPPKLPKPLPVPDSKPPKKRRGGRRLRKMNQRYAMTDIRKMANRMAFGI